MSVEVLDQLADGTVTRYRIRRGSRKRKRQLRRIKRSDVHNRSKRIAAVFSRLDDTTTIWFNAVGIL